MKIAVIHSIFSDTIGGGEKTSIALANALSHKNDVDYYWQHETRGDELEEFLGFALEDELSLFKVNKPAVAKAASRIGRFTLARVAFENRYFQTLAKDLEDEYDKIVFTSKLFKSEVVYDTETVQYIHSSNQDAQNITRRCRAYKWLSKRFVDLSQIKRTDTVLFNSDYTKTKSMKTNGDISSNQHVVHPPVNTDIQPISWDEKDNKAVILGRITPTKRIEDAIKIVEGTDLSITVAGRAEDEEYLQKLKDVLKDREGSVKPNLSWKDVKKEVKTSKIGFCCKKNENFGIVVAEYMKAGTIPLVRGGSGPEEIVERSQLKFDSIEEARSKAKSLTPPGRDLLDHVEARSKDFSLKRFANRVRSIV